MDKKIRRNEICVIGLPRCDFVFSSTRSCFIGYGFGTSDLEVGILKRILEERTIEPIEAGGTRAPGENAFCVKICSKIITAQFCITLLNEDERDGNRQPNPNVNMEYGLMLGFNKYVIPFQREEQPLPFNVAALDTIKYTNQNFVRLATEAIDQAIGATRQDPIAPMDLSQRLYAFLLANDVVLASLDADGDKNIYQLGAPLGFNLLHDFGGTQYIFLGNFTTLRPEVVIWRVRMLVRAIDGRRATWPIRMQSGMMTDEQARIADALFAQFQIWLLVNSDGDKNVVEAGMREQQPASYQTRIFSMTDVDAKLAELGHVG